jgi:ATP-binding cassette subfamily B protein
MFESFKSLRTLKPYFWRYRWEFLFGGFCVLMLNGIWALFPLVLRGGIDLLDKTTTAVTEAQDALWLRHMMSVLHIPAKISDLLTRPKSLPLSLHNIELYAFLLLGVAGGKALFQFLTRWKLIGISREIEFDLRNDLFRHLEGLSYSYYQRTRTGDIMARATNDLNAVRMLLGPAIMYSANTIVFTAFALLFMYHISPRLMFYAFLPLPVVSVVIQYFGRKIHERFERIQAMFSDISARAQENFSGVRVLRAFVQEQAEINAFEKANQEYIARSLKLVRLMGMLWPTLELMLGLAIVMVLWLGGREVIHHNLHSRTGMTVGDFVAFTTYMVQLTWPIIALGWVINIVQRGTASMQRINQIFEEKPEITDAAAAPRLGGEQIRGEIEFRNLNFAYNGVSVLRNVNLRIRAGSSLAIVGPTGSGKTTLVNLIPRIYDAASGMVLLDGRPISEYPLETLRRSIGFVPQETFLFSESVGENIAFGAENAGVEEIRAAARGASIATEIEEFPEQYKTVVGERGITLSGGQKQRTAIARAILRDPRILVLDDALSSVDTYTEEKILEHLREVMRGRTTLFISHRVSTVKNADRIAVLHSGEIVELGTHEELLARNGYYTDLYNKQLLEEELAEV